MSIDKQWLKDFLAFEILDVFFFLAFGYLVLSSRKAELISLLCAWFVLAYMVTFLIQNLIIFCKQIFSNKRFSIFALIISLNFLIILFMFFTYGLMTQSFSWSGFTQFDDPKTVILYTCGIISIAALFYKDHIKSSLKKNKATNQDEDTLP